MTGFLAALAVVVAIVACAVCGIRPLAFLDHGPPYDSTYAHADDRK